MITQKKTLLNSNKNDKDKNIERDSREEVDVVYNKQIFKYFFIYNFFSIIEKQNHLLTHKWPHPNH